MNKTLQKNILLPILLALILCALVVSFSLSTPSVAVASMTIEDLTVVAGKGISEQEDAALRNGFDTYANGKNLGTAGEINTAREIIYYRDYTDGANITRVVYNFAKKAYYRVGVDMYSAYIENDNFRRLGAPVTEQGTYTLSGRSVASTITSGSYNAQIFEKGVLINGASDVTMYVGAVETVSENTFKLHPVIDDQDIFAYIDGEMKYFGNVDGEMHPLKDVDFIANADGSFKMYANYSSCCVAIEYNADYSIDAQYTYAARNFFVNGDGKYETAILPVACLSIKDMVCDGGNPVDSAALSYYQTAQPGGTSDSLIKLFTDCYSRLLTEGYVAGYRCSRIKMWDLLVLDLRNGDSTTGFDSTGSGARERITCLVYNPEQNKVYPVKDSYFLKFKEDDGIGRVALGYPESDIMYNKTVGEVAYSEIQFFQNGYIYKSEGGYYVATAGAVYDAEKNEMVPLASPVVPDRYGVETERREKDGAIYINYQKGAIKCDLTINKSKYYYTFYNGRNFDFTTEEYEVKLLALSKLFVASELSSSGTMPVGEGDTRMNFESQIKPKLVLKVAELYNEGFFCGFYEEPFKSSWNSVYAQQFVVGDSTAMIFGSERPNVCALVYNPELDKVFLLKDDVIKAWQANFRTAGYPTCDEYQVSGCDYYFQTFDFGMTIRYGNLIVFTEDFESPEKYVEEMKANGLSFPTHGGKQENGYKG